MVDVFVENNLVVCEGQPLPDLQQELSSAVRCPAYEVMHFLGQLFTAEKMYYFRAIKGFS